MFSNSESNDSGNKYDQTARTTYDGFGRVETITDPFGNVIKNIYDESTGLLQGKKTKTEDGTLTGFSEYTYDDLGRKKTETTYRFTPSGGTLPTDPTEYVATTTTYCYDDRGNVEMTFDTDGNAVDTTYDSVNRVKTRRWYTDQSGLACGAESVK